MNIPPNSSQTLPIELFERQQDWALWLHANHELAAGVWLKLAKKGSETRSVTYDEAVETALCFGWIDGQKKKLDDKH